MIIAKIVAVLIIGYILGSIPSGVLIGKRFARVDVRNYGSGKMGTTNVLRVAGKKAAALVCICDVVKGALAVVFAWLVLRGEYRVVLGSAYWWLLKSAPVLAALAAIAGHNWPIFLKFRGGRGVATFFGGLFALCPAAALFSGQVLILGAGLTRFASLASISGAVATYVILIPLTILNRFPIEYLAYALIGTITIVVTHRDNIIRLLNGKERKIGEKTETATPPPSPNSMG
jgi:glycerol-3-phosphate acyltransferase PlsY